MELINLEYLTLKLTNKCNLKCFMCGQVYSRSRSSFEEININYIEKILQEAIGIKHIYLYGGEPMLYSDISELLSILYNQDKTVRITTNGTLLESYAEELVKYKVANVEISMDSFHDDILEKIRGVKILSNIQNGIRKLNEEKKKMNSEFPHININCVILPQNYKEMKEFVEFVKNQMIGVESINFEIPVITTKEIGALYEKKLKNTFSIQAESWKWFYNKIHPLSDNELRDIYEKICILQENPRVTMKRLKDYKELYNLLSQHYEIPKRNCECPYAAITVLPNGDITFCTDFPDVILGNIYCQSIEDIWLGEKSNKFRTYLEEEGSLPICARCVHKDEILL